jgi:hypothetical protein
MLSESNVIDTIFDLFKFFSSIQFDM